LAWRGRQSKCHRQQQTKGNAEHLDESLVSGMLL
jgi:hypothetical protein